MAGSEVTISKVGEARPWQTQQGGQFVSYKIELWELPGVHELTQKPETPAPQVGQKFFGEVHPPNREGFPPKIKKVQGFGHADAQRTHGGRGNSRSPEETKSIVRQHSQEMALRAIDIAFREGLYDVREDWVDPEGLRGLVGKWTDFFEKDAAA